MNRTAARPLSPHLSIWKWGPHMLVSILHRACGVALATAGTLIFVWWLVALAAGPESYASFHYWIVAADQGALGGRITNWLARIAAIGLSWALFQHLANGVRHFMLDMGAGFELRANRAGALWTLTFSAVATVALWAYILVGKA